MNPGAMMASSPPRRSTLARSSGIPGPTQVTRPSSTRTEPDGISSDGVMTVPRSRIRIRARPEPGAELGKRGRTRRLRESAVGAHAEPVGRDVPQTGADPLLDVVCGLDIRILDVHDANPDIHAFRDFCG